MAKQSKVDRTGIYRFQDDGHYREAPLVDTRRHAPTDWDRDEFADLVLIADTTSQRILKSQGYNYTARTDEDGVPAIVSDAREVLDLIYQLSLTDDGEFIYVDPARAWHIGAAFQRLMARAGEPMAVAGVTATKGRSTGGHTTNKEKQENRLRYQAKVDGYVMKGQKVNSAKNNTATDFGVSIKTIYRHTKNAKDKHYAKIKPQTPPKKKSKKK